MLPRIGDVLKYWRTILRSGVIGVYVGILPGVGEDMAAWSSYAAAKRASKEKEQFGKGSIEGLMAAETGDNASIPGGIIPALALAIPGSAPSAVLMAAMIIHGVQPGPMLMVNQPQFVYDVVAMTLLATLGMLFYGLFLVRPLLAVIRIPRSIIMPVDLRAVHRRLVRDRLARVRHLRDARHRHRDVPAAPAELPGAAVRARPRARRHPRQEPAPRPDAVERRLHAVLHPAGVRRARG